MKILLKCAISALLVLAILFCLYGALASTEPRQRFPFHTEWLVGYMVAALGFSMVLATVLRPRRSQSRGNIRK